MGEPPAPEGEASPPPEGGAQGEPPSPPTETSSGGGMSSGEKAGIAIGVLLAVGAGIAAFVILRQRRQARGGWGANSFQR